MEEKSEIAEIQKDLSPLYLKRNLRIIESYESYCHS